MTDQVTDQVTGDAVAGSTAKDIHWILSVLPHRYPFLLVDRVLELEAGARIVAIKNFTINEEFFQGHFPDHPVVPGVLLVEGMAQAGGLLALHDHPDRDNTLVYFAGIDRARFRRPVLPGDQVRYEINILRFRPRICKMAAEAFVGDELVAEATLISSMVDR